MAANDAAMTPEGRNAMFKHEPYYNRQKESIVRSHLRRGTWLAGLVSLCVALAQTTAAAAPLAPQMAPAAAPAAVSPDQVIQQTGEFLRNLKSFSAEVTVAGTVDIQGRRQPATMRYQFALSRPGRYTLFQKTALPSPTLVCDGSKFYTFAPAQMKYSVRKAPALPNKSAFAEISGTANGAGTILVWALEDSPAEAIREGTSDAKYKGLDTSTGAKCHHLVLEQSGWKRDMWIEAGDKPLIRKISFSRANPSAASDRSNSRSVPVAVAPELVVTLANWTVDADLPAETFQFTPPQGAKQVAASQLQESKYPAFSLKGQAAPAFVVPLLDGGQLNLASLKGSIVVLDFWATWCPPCRKGLPILAEVAKEYKDKGVRVFAIDCDETPAQVRQFITSTQLQLPVALDAGKTVAKRYSMRAIPQTVIIDKNGIVQCVHVGLPGDAKQSYKSTIDALLAGKDLTADASQEEEGSVSTDQDQP